MNRHRFLFAALATSAFAGVILTALPLVVSFDVLTRDSEATTGQIAKVRARIIALRDARSDARDGGRRFDILASGLDTDAPESARPAAALVVDARARERRGEANPDEVERALAALDLAIVEAGQSSGRPQWLDAAHVAGILLILVALALAARERASFARERIRISAVLKRDVALADDRRLGDAVKDALYAERLKSVEPATRPGEMLRHTEPPRGEIAAAVAPARPPAAPTPALPSTIPASDDLPPIAAPDIIFNPPDVRNLAAPVPVHLDRTLAPDSRAEVLDSSR